MSPGGRRLPLRRGLARMFAVSGLLVLVAAMAATYSFVHLVENRRAVINHVDPAELLVSQLLAAYLDEETGVRGYVLTGDSLFLEPFEAGATAVRTADAELGALLSGDRDRALLAGARRAGSDWDRQFAGPARADVATGQHRPDSNEFLVQGKNLFDNLRLRLNDLQINLAAERREAIDRLSRSSDQLVAVMTVSLVLVVANGLVIWLALGRLVLRPVSEVAGDARTVTSGDLDHEVRRAGPPEIADLAGEIESMRLKIYAEMAAAQEAQQRMESLNADLARSNQDLEQFAYVASHDLQEPLRKVTSFCQLIEQRYSGQLDERGEQYIAFAVDGAKRMQVLINDLLAFSRIGRSTDRFAPVDLRSVLDQALKNLETAVEHSGAEVRVEGALPTVTGDATLFTVLLQNLVGNAIKFRGDDAPVVTVSAFPRDEDWLLSVADNGIGIEPRFAERIFVIFQRLHSRDAYSGTGIGLAMCRKIVEFHGGHIWLDVDHEPGTRFCFTLPQMAARPGSPTPEDGGNDELGSAVHAR